MYVKPRSKEVEEDKEALIALRLNIHASFIDVRFVIEL